MSILSSSWHSPQKIYALGHRATQELIRRNVTVQEKVDGSFFAAGVFDGELKCRSKGAVLNTLAPEKMFTKAVATAQELAPQMTPGWTYRGEYLQKPKHNALAYDRIPARHWVLFDICTGDESYLGYADLKAEAERLGLEVVPELFAGELDLNKLRELLETTSMLGGQKIEGVVIKPANFDIFDQDKKVLFAKFVSEAFKEVHAHAWKESNPGPADIRQRLAEAYATETRWHKAAQHLAERGELEQSPRDIGKLLKEVQQDVLAEEEDSIKQKLFDWAKGHILRGSTAGLPQWWKEQLAKQAFEGQEAA